MSTAAPGPAAPAIERIPARRTPLKEIPDALCEVWRTCCPETPGGVVARALTANFVAVADARDEAVLREATARLLRRTPCRAFLLLLDAAVPATVADVAAAMRNQGQVRDIVLEEIVVRLPPAWFPQLPGLLRPLLESDLPVHLFWYLGWPANERDFDDLLRLCDHVVVDSRCFAQPLADLPQLEKRRQRGRRITDLQWLVLRPWRRALAEAFERIPWRPGTPVQGTIRHGTGGTAAALLLAQWLDQRLAATFAVEDSGSTASAGVERVVLQVAGHEADAVSTDARITVHVTTPERCHLPFSVPASRGASGDLLAAAIDLA